MWSKCFKRLNERSKGLKGFIFGQGSHPSSAAPLRGRSQPAANVLSLDAPPCPCRRTGDAHPQDKGVGNQWNSSHHSKRNAWLIRRELPFVKHSRFGHRSCSSLIEVDCVPPRGTLCPHSWTRTTGRSQPDETNEEFARNSWAAATQGYPRRWSVPWARSQLVLVYSVE